MSWGSWRDTQIEAGQRGHRAGYDAGGVAWPESERIMVNPYDRQQQPWLWWWWREAWLRGRDKKREAMMLLAQAKKETLTPREALLVTQIKSLIDAMEMQEKRMDESLHIPSHVAGDIWRKAKEEARQAVAEVEHDLQGDTQ